MGDVSFKTQKEKIRSYHNGFVATHLINIGHQVGLLKGIFDTTNGITVPELASKLGLHEPYVKIWCQTACCLEILDRDDEGRYKFQPYFDELLGNDESIRNIASRFSLLVDVSGERLKNSPEYFKTGKIIESYSPERSEIVGEASKKIHENMGVFLSLLPKDVPIKKMLKKGSRLLDVGCGGGRMIIELAQKYKNSYFVGIDIIPYGIERAKKTILDLNLNDQVQVECIGGQDLSYNDEFDIVSFIVTLHEIHPSVRPKVVKKTYQALKNDGKLFIIDWLFPEKFEDFKNPEYEPGIFDQFNETCLGVILPNKSEQDKILSGVGFKNIQHIPAMEGINIITAIK